MPSEVDARGFRRHFLRRRGGSGKLRPLQNSFPSRQPKPKHRFSAVFAPNTS
ncbi:TPA: hypothetical protein WGQ83_002089 [Neisseria meningitidis]